MALLKDEEKERKFEGRNSLSYSVGGEALTARVGKIGRHPLAGRQVLTAVRHCHCHCHCHCHFTSLHCRSKRSYQGEFTQLLGLDSQYILGYNNRIVLLVLREHVLPIVGTRYREL